MAQVHARGRVTVPLQLRRRLNIKDGNYIRLALVEILSVDKAGRWVKRKVK